MDCCSYYRKKFKEKMILIDTSFKKLIRIFNSILTILFKEFDSNNKNHKDF